MQHVTDQYDAEFFDFVRERAAGSSRRVVALIIELFDPRSVVDVGCGLGTWLATFADAGLDHCVGVDGEHVDVARLEVPPERFLARDLTRPLELAESFDLALSLEVAEHLPPSAADIFVASLTRLAPIVVFSAAIPGQGGVEHVNEQWPDYWVEKFAARGFAVVDCLRPVLWDDDKVEWWYAQNTLAFVRDDELTRRPALHELRPRWPLALVHPQLFGHRTFRIDWLEKRDALKRDIAAIVPRGSSFVLVDDDELGPLGLEEREQLGFLEDSGDYSGAAAVRELEALAAGGAAAIVFAWPALWSLDYYDELAAHLRTRFECVAESERLVAFAFGAPAERA